METATVLVLSSLGETRFHTHMKQQAKC